MRRFGNLLRFPAYQWREMMLPTTGETGREASVEEMILGMLNSRLVGIEKEA